MGTMPRAAATALVVAMMMAFPSAIGATLIALDDPVFGPASLTRDTDTGLDWLDVFDLRGPVVRRGGESVGPGGEFAGFRYAMRDEVADLLRSIGIDNISGPPPSVESYAPAVMLQALIGETSAEFTLGVNGTDAGNGRHFGTLVWRDDATQVAGAEDFEYMIPDDQTGSFGHWLVRAVPVPEPSLLALVNAGLLMMRWRGAARK